MPKQKSTRPRAFHVRLLFLALLMMASLLALSLFLRGSANVDSLKFDIRPSESRSKFHMKRKPARFQSSFPSSLVTPDAATPPTRTKSETIVDKVEFRLSESGSEFLGNGKPAPFQSPFPSGFVSADAVPPPTRTGAASPPTRTKSKTIANKVEVKSGPYHNWELFARDFQEMMRSFKIYVYPDAFMNQSFPQSSPFAHIFLPHPNPFDPRLGNYFSEHMFKVALLRSSLVTPHPEQAHLFFLPFSINLLRNDPRVHSEASIAEFVAQYTSRIRSQFAFWNASAGADHFYVHCHSVGRDAASRHQDLQNNAIQVSCSSSYFQRSYFTHKDVSLPQVWPRPPEKALTPPDARCFYFTLSFIGNYTFIDRITYLYRAILDLTKFQSSRDMYKYLVINLYSDSNFRFTVVGLLTYRHKLAYFAGRIQNSRIRQELIDLWGNDSSMEIFSGSSSFSYEEGFRRSKYCLHVKGYEVNTARVSDAIHYGCIPVIISNHYELPLANVLDWSKFSVIINNGEISSIKKRLLSITKQMYLTMFHNLRLVRKHFSWRKTPSGFDSFHMTAYQLWLRRSVHRLPH